jgi:NADH:ubiquinone oxidoreductase subunit 6 (subunit J)
MWADVPFALTFYVVAAILLVSSLAVVLLPNVIHSALSLALSFLAVAAIFVLLNAEFVAFVQILIYAGAVMVLLLFAVMLTRHSGSPLSNLPNMQAKWAAVVAGLVFVGLAGSFVGTSWPVQAQALPADITALLGQLIFGKYVLAFEAASLLLLAAMVGAIVIARE